MIVDILPSTKEEEEEEEDKIMISGPLGSITEVGVKSSGRQDFRVTISDSAPPERLSRQWASLHLKPGTLGVQ